MAVNVAALLRNQLRGRPCRVFSPDLRVRVLETGLATYPDVTVICDQLEKDPEDPKGNTITNPKVIVEVLSPSTEAYDRGEKLANYKRIPALEEIVLVGHDARRIEVWRRQDEGWSLEVTTGDASASLSSISSTLPVADVYEDPLAD